MHVPHIHTLKSRFELFVSSFSQPSPVARSESELKAIARETRGLAIYHHQRCPLSIKITRLVRQLNIPLELRNIGRSQIHRDDLIAGLGDLRTPCLKIVEQGAVSWVCGEQEVAAYLQERFPGASADKPA